MCMNDRKACSAISLEMHGLKTLTFYLRFQSRKSFDRSDVDVLVTLKLFSKRQLNSILSKKWRVEDFPERVLHIVWHNFC